MTEQEQEFARIRGYLQQQAAQRTTEELITRVQEAVDELAAAARALPVAQYAVTHAGENWSPKECVEHSAGSDAEVSRQVLHVALTGERPGERPEPAVPGSLEAALAEHQVVMDSLYAHVREADPTAHLEVKWPHPFFGELNWREWLLFLRIHDKDHARQLQKMAN